MAAKAQNTTDYDPSVSALARQSNSTTTARPMAQGTGGPYSTGLQTSFNPYGDIGEGYDADVREVQRRTNELEDARLGRNSGVSGDANRASISAALARINLKNQLGSNIASNGQMEQEAEDSLKTTAERNLAKGLKTTRQNYNQRGLLYSGAREGGENALKASVGSGLAGDIASTKSEYANSLNAQKQAYANVGLQQQQQQMDMANQAFETATRNSIARQQAYQQVSQGLGQAAGYAYGRSQTPSTSMGANPNSYSSVNSQTLYQPELGSSAGYGRG